MEKRIVTLEELMQSKKELEEVMSEMPALAASFKPVLDAINERIAVRQKPQQC